MKKKDYIIIGITGGIGAGKSTVADFFRSKSYAVISADVLAREITSPGSTAWKEIKKKFGAKAVQKNGQLNRAFIREKISHHPQWRKKLEKITHPKIQKLFLKRAKALTKHGKKIIFYEAPLLFEAKSTHNMDAIICVSSSTENRVRRAQARDAVNSKQIRKLITAQMPQKEKEKLSDYIIKNNGSIADLKKNSLRILKEICKKYKTQSEFVET